MVEPLGGRTLLAALVAGAESRIREALHLDVIAFRRTPSASLAPLHGPEAVAAELIALASAAESWTLTANTPDSVLISALRADHVAFSLEARLEDARAVGLMIRTQAA
jgi:hypothetical protein